MKRHLFCIFMMISSCRSGRTLDIYIENGSVLQKTIQIELYIDGKLSNNIEVDRGQNVTINKHVKITLPRNKPITISFEIPNSNYKTKCVVNPETLTSETWMHVAFGETLFKKGYEFLGTTLDKDTIVERKFYCELVDQPICGKIQE